MMTDTAHRDHERYRLHADICRVLTDPKRLMILDVLREGDRPVGELADELGCTLANASQHLAVLRSAGLVETQRAGTVIRYHLAEPELVQACDIIQRIVARRQAARTGRELLSASEVSTVVGAAEPSLQPTLSR
jgi:ArsR family transcriptional regulator, virulence genes transcriptional regulator